jgi:RHS repeat-associated protein
MVSGSNQLAKRYYYIANALVDSLNYTNDKNGAQIRDHRRQANKFYPDDRYYDVAGRMIHEKNSSDEKALFCDFGIGGCGGGLIIVKRAKLYRYDGLGRRVGWTAGSNHFATFYDGNNVVYHHGAEFLPGPGTDNPLMVFLHPGWSVNCVTNFTAGMVTLGGRLYDYHGPAGYDCIGTGDIGGNWRNWAAHGGAIQASHTFAQSRARSADSPTLSYYRNRFYNAETGRFTQEDPIGHAGGLNLYGYSGQAPAMFTDPFGLCPEEQQNEDGLCPGGLTVEQWELIQKAAQELRQEDREWLLRLLENGQIRSATLGRNAGMATGYLWHPKLINVNDRFGPEKKDFLVSVSTADLAFAFAHERGHQRVADTTLELYFREISRRFGAELPGEARANRYACTAILTKGSLSASRCARR